jgi:hypothetical protein
MAVAAAVLLAMLLVAGIDYHRRRQVRWRRETDVLRASLLRLRLSGRNRRLRRQNRKLSRKI